MNMEITRLIAGPVSTNTYVVSDESTREAAIVDPEGDGEIILSHLAERGLTLNKILLTHGHFDHIGAVDFLQERTGVPVYLAKEDWELLADGEKNASVLFLGYPVACRATPLPLCDGDTVSIGGERLLVRATAGHTRGSVVFFTDGDSVLTGDTVFAYGHGRTDLYGGDEGTMADTLAWLSPMLVGKMVYSGHGPAKRKK